MKNKFFALFLNIIAIIFALGIAIVGILMYFDIFSEETNETTYIIDSIATEKPEEDSLEKKTNQSVITESITNKIQTVLNSSSVINNTNANDTTQSNAYPEENQYIQNFFYNQLNENQKIIYNGLRENKENLKQGNYVIDFGEKFSSILTTENGSQILGDDYQTAIEAFTHDYADLFFLDVNKMLLNIETTTKLFRTTYKVYISAREGQNYLSNDFTSGYQVQITNSAIEKVKNQILSNLKETDYEKILYIHDYLVDNIEYDSSYNGIGSYDIYGALVEKRCVCEGYAKAFKYLTNSAGIECEIMQGTATNSSGQTESHAWNCVKLNGIWYEVDCTWDDPIITGNGRINRDIKYRYFLKGTEVFDKDHVNSYQFSEGGKFFSYPTISKSNY